MSTIENEEKHQTSPVSTNRKLSIKKIVKPNLQVARPNRNKRKSTKNISESEAEESDIITDLLKQIEELKKEIEQLKKSSKESKKDEQKIENDNNEMDIVVIQSPSTSQQKEDQEDWVTIREARPPPINVFDQQVKDTIQVLRKGTKTNDFQIKRMSDHLHVVKMNDYNDYKKTIELLKETNTQYFTYTPKQDKTLQLLLKGLDNTYEPKEIMEMINNLEIPNLSIKNITRFETPKSIELQRKLPIYMIQINPDSNEGALRSIKALDNQLIYWEGLRKKENARTPELYDRPLSHEQR
ncbi:hypothetical protein PV328_012051 [Microctonus aethiopoides]|uniref:Pre-C2HC domain-containing protein n=1 Tax=Microctonus aethiopoides TaxID=144406 RepID=A0AA39KPY0_9HYME|nr:hypothetical protein PV328_012051 [Microctonus aethiopoides]